MEPSGTLSERPSTARTCFLPKPYVLTSELDWMAKVFIVLLQGVVELEAALRFR